MGDTSGDFARDMPGAGHSRGRLKPALEAAVRSCVTIPVRRRRARHDSATSWRCACGPARYRRLAIKRFYSQARALRNWMRSRDVLRAPCTPRAGPGSRGLAWVIAPTGLCDTARSDGQRCASVSRFHPLIPLSRHDFEGPGTLRKPVAWTMHDTLSRCQAAPRTRRIADGARRMEARP